MITAKRISRPAGVSSVEQPAGGAGFHEATQTVDAIEGEPQGAGLVARFLDKDGLIAIGDVADWFGLSKGQLAATLGIKPEALRRLKRLAAPKSQTRVKEMLEIIGRIAPWAGGKDQAMAWYRAEPLPAFGGRTAEFLVKEGQAEAVRDYLDHIAVGGFA
jgi:hypothetical protein